MFIWPEARCPPESTGFWLGPSPEVSVPVPGMGHHPSSPTRHAGKMPAWLRPAKPTVWGGAHRAHANGRMGHLPHRYPNPNPIPFPAATTSSPLRLFANRLTPFPEYEISAIAAFSSFPFLSVRPSPVCTCRRRPRRIISSSSSPLDSDPPPLFLFSTHSTLASHQLTTVARHLCRLAVGWAPAKQVTIPNSQI